MSLICKDGVSSCSACGSCFEFLERCSVCKRPMRDGEKYYKLRRKAVCEECMEDAAKGKCILCQRQVTDGIRYGDMILCRSCSGVATGYVGYI